MVRLPMAQSFSWTCAPDLRLMLINPPQSYPLELREEYQSYFPVGIASLAAAVEPMGVQLRLVDCLAHPEESRDGELVWFGMGMARLRVEIERFRPHIVGIANPFSMFISDAIAVADLVKAVDPSIQVLVGGIESSVAPNNRRLIERAPSIDLLVKSEGELTLRDLVSRFRPDTRDFRDLPEVLGILYRDANGAVQETDKRPFITDLDSLPMPAYHLLDMDLMFANPFYAKFRSKALQRRCLPVHTSRGCPYSCNFCSVHSQVGKANRRHSPELVTRHIEFLKSTYGVTHIHFEDDNLTVNPKHTVQLFSALKPLGITFDTPNGIRADTITPEVAVLLKEAGATSITIAVESGDQDILNRVIRKALDLDDVLTAAAALDRADVVCAAFFIVGFPGETETEVRRTLRYARDLTHGYSTMNMLFVANPLPGTPLHKECVENSYLLQELNKRSLFCGIRLNQDPLIETPQFSKADLFRWSREELDRPDLLCRGYTMPIFCANTERARLRAARFFDMPIRHMQPYPWSNGYLGAIRPAGAEARSAV